MTEVFLGQIMLTGFAFAPKGFALCNGQLLSISQNQALFSLLGTTYGGNGQTTFALPNMQGRTPVAFGTSADPGWQPTAYQLGETGGAENVTVLTTQLPLHNHQCSGTTATGSQRNPTNALYGTNTAALYAPANGAQVPLSPQSIAPAGGTQPHPNMQPFDVINYCIALAGIFPSRN
ncbi:tail fiber protein [Pseudoxanthomonas sp. CF125]|jgi:microcystin-dependent protein|uniref:phage tail protein n=1 Tax=Pseudoxanthomonas sp. CF125 TaxID=1855303 RepID=UPI00088FD189|nr:tail fiber protein [Pseudoxanthomonas sp. CF125]SDQ85235.1 Microcystin-dependent protein [Pseudoxanthomonas sp. CF125]